MARGPDGARLGAPGAEEVAPLTDEQVGFVRGIEGVVDRALERHPAGDPFLFGIYQELDPPVREFLVRRYAAAGWGEVGLKPGLTGAFSLVLVP